MKKIPSGNRSKLIKTHENFLFIHKKYDLLTSKRILTRKYNSSENYFYTNIIDNVLNKKNGCPSIINFKDTVFNDNQEHLQKYYTLPNLNTQKQQIIEYYRYYSQKPIIFIKQLFKQLIIYQEKIKIIQYNKLKQILSLESEHSSTTLKKNNNQIKNISNANILSQITISCNDNSNIGQQSYCLDKLKQLLVVHFGQSKLKTLKQIDLNFQVNHLSKTDKQKKSFKLLRHSIQKSQKQIKKNNNGKKHNHKKSRKNKICNASCPDLKKQFHPINNTITKRKKPNKSVQSEGKQNIEVYKKCLKPNIMTNEHGGKATNSYNIHLQNERKIKTNISQIKNKIKIAKQREWRKIVNSTESSYQKFKTHKRR